MTRKVSALNGLTAKQAGVTLIVVLLLTIVVGAVQAWSEWRTARADMRNDMGRSLALIAGSAAEAAFQLNSQQAEKVVSGLFHLDTVGKVVLRDNFGKVLAEQTRPGGARDALAQWLFGDIASFSLPLRQPELDSRDELVGQMDVELIPSVVAEGFFSRALRNAVMEIAGAIVICSLVVLIFYLMITRPLLTLAKSIARVDPLHPADRLVPICRGHINDEMGLLVHSLNDLLVAFQTGLSQRDRAEAGLKELTRNLEQRVADRTSELELAMIQLEREKEETERAFTRLDHAHRELNKANGLILESIRYASKIQDALLPDKTALGNAVADIHVCWEPLQVVGGDYFWLERIGPLSLIVVVDCTGHGVPGAFMTMIVASALDRILHHHNDLRPSAILEMLDELVRNRLRQDRPDSSSDDGLDAAICIYDDIGKVVTYAGANLPLLYAKDGEVQEIKADRASLGYRTLRPAMPLTDHEIAVEPGMSFYLLTDGVPDHMGGAPRRLLGRKRLKAILADNLDKPLSEQMTALEAALDDYRGCEPRRDDMTLVGFRPL